MHKLSVQSVLDAQPESIDLEAFLEQLLLRQQIEAGEQDAAAGRVSSNDEAKRRLERWLE